MKSNLIFISTISLLFLTITHASDYIITADDFDTLIDTATNSTTTDSTTPDSTTPDLTESETDVSDANTSNSNSSSSNPPSLNTSSLNTSNSNPSSCIINGAYQCNLNECECHASNTSNWLYFILGSSSMILTSVIIIACYRYKPLKDRPGDIILGMTISDFVTSFFWVYSAFYDLNGGTMDPDGFGCESISTITTFSTLTSFSYNICFCLYIIVAVKNSLRQTKQPKSLFHIISISMGIIYTISNASLDKLGMSYYGTCSTKTSEFNLYAPFVPLVFVGLACYTYLTVRKYSPECERVSEGKRSFIIYYLRYMIVSSLTYFSLALSYLFIGFNVESSKSNVVGLQTFTTLSKIALVFALCIIRYGDPFLNPYLMNLLGLGSLGRKSAILDISLQQPLAINATYITPRIVRFGLPPDRGLMGLASKKTDENQMTESGVGWLTHNLKVQIIYTMLSGILYSIFSISRQENSYGNNDNICIDEEKNEFDDTKGELLAKEAKSYAINDDVIGNNLPTLLEELNKRSYKTLNGSVTIYAPELFKILIKQDDHFLNINESLDLEQNYSKIQKAGKAIGGKSGEFFFFSFDNKLIIKTLNEVELNVLLERLSNYVKHFYNNPDTLIAKIYGVFTFARNNEEKYHLVVMRNVNGYPSECVERKYDLKGSTYDREVLKKKVLRMDQLRFEEDALKDIDFMKYDKKLYVDERLKQKLINTLTEDAMFFKKCGIIDYSLAVYVINKKKLQWRSLNKDNQNDGGTESKRGSYMVRSSILNTNNEQALDESNNNKELTMARNDTISINGTKPMNELYSIKSMREDVYYNLGIIDYLQLYTRKKKWEKIGKRIMKLNWKLDTSSQNPVKYADRFARFIHKIVE